jgi:hypothetical protein
VTTVLYRWRAELDLADALSTFDRNTIVLVETPAQRPTVGMWLAEHRLVVDVEPDGLAAGRAIGRLRHRTPADLAGANAYAARAFTPALDLHWRAPGVAVWQSERPFRVDVSGAEGVPTQVAGEPFAHGILRRGRPVAHVPLPGWSAWGDAEMGVVWYPIDSASLPADAVAVLWVADYAVEVDDGPAAGCVVPLTTRWVAWVALPRVVTFSP